MEPGSVITDVQPYSPEWWSLRYGTFTASEIFKIMTDPRSSKDEISKTAETYILEKVHEKLTGKAKQGIDNFATEWGNDHEPMAKKWYAKLTKHNLSEPVLCFHPIIIGFSCTPDTFVNDDGLCEIKCPANGANHLKHCFVTNNEYFKKEHPEYYWQCLAQMNITGRKWCDFVSFDPRINSDLGMFIYKMEYNAADALLMEERIIKGREIFDGYYKLFSGNV